MPIIGSLAGASSRGLGGLISFSSTSSGDFHSIASYEVTGSNTSTITLSNIPSTYKHLRIHTITRLASNSPSGAPAFRCNGYSGANDYIDYYLLTQDQTNAANAYFNGSSNAMSFMVHSVASGSMVQSDYFSNSLIDVIDYTNTTTFKTFKSETGFYNVSGNATESQTRIALGVFRKKEAINQITLYHPDNFVVKSRVDLYGIKG